MTLSTNPNYYTELINGSYPDFYEYEEMLTKDFAITNATKTQLKKLGVASGKGIYDYENSGRGWLAKFKNFVRKKDEAKVKAYLDAKKLLNN